MGKASLKHSTTAKWYTIHTRKSSCIQYKSVRDYSTGLRVLSLLRDFQQDSDRNNSSWRLTFSITSKDMWLWYRYIENSPQFSRRTFVKITMLCPKMKFWSIEENIISQLELMEVSTQNYPYCFFTRAVLMKYTRSDNWYWKIQLFFDWKTICAALIVDNMQRNLRWERLSVQIPFPFTL